MKKIYLGGNISSQGLNLLGPGYFASTEVLLSEAIGAIVRSKDINDMKFSNEFLAIARAGIDFKNIPVSRCTENGVCVFNTPGSNANAVKELTLLAMLMSGRKITESIAFLKSMLNATIGEIEDAVEEKKNQFVGPELKGKVLGVIGLGFIGSMIANMAVDLGMKVVGYDPFITNGALLNLSHEVQRVEKVEDLLATSDFITFHITLTDANIGFLNSEKLAFTKKGVRIFNFSRRKLVVEEDIIFASSDGHVAAYFTDFASPALLNCKRVFCFPHLGASTPEAEENSAMMATKQLKDYLEFGVVKNSVNFPAVEDRPSSDIRIRLAIVNKDVPNMIASNYWNLRWCWNKYY
jgi:D-3-phosphoglycerate dehydrogenase